MTALQTQQIWRPLLLNGLIAAIQPIVSAMALILEETAAMLV